MDDFWNNINSLLFPKALYIFQGITYFLYVNGYFHFAEVQLF